MWAPREDVFQTRRYGPHAQLRCQRADPGDAGVPAERSVPRSRRVVPGIRMLRVRTHRRRQSARRGRRAGRRARGRPSMRSSAVCTSRCAQFSGAISAEHGIGLERKSHLGISRSRGGDRDHARAEEGARSARNSQPRQGVRCPGSLSTSGARRAGDGRRHADGLRLGCRRQHRQGRAAGARGRRARRADHPAAGAVRDAVLLHRAGRAPSAASRAASPTTAPCGTSAPSRASSASCCRSASSSAPGTAYFNSIAILDADGTQPRRLSQVAHPQRPGLPGEELLQPRRHGLQGVAHALRAHRCRDLLGPVVPGDRARHGAAGRGAVLLPDGDRHASRRRRCR